MSRWYVIVKATRRAATFYLRGPDEGKPVPFDTEEKARNNLDFLVQGNFYRSRDDLEVTTELPQNNSFKS